DRYVPRQFMNQGDRLAFSNGIVGLSAFAGFLLVIFGGQTHALIPLYVFGGPHPGLISLFIVRGFSSLPFSEASMVVRWRRLRTPRWHHNALVNGVGAVVTGVVLLVVAATKAHEGAWIIILLIPVIVVFFRMTRGHYDEVAAQLTLKGWQPRRARHNTVLVPISGIQRATVEALDYAKTLSTDARAIY